MLNTDQPLIVGNNILITDDKTQIRVGNVDLEKQKLNK